jgi:hypothetical protein
MSESTALILRTLSTSTGHYTIRQRPTDGFICVTDICTAAGKLYNDWRRQLRVEEYLQELRRSTGIPIDLLLISITTGPNEERGTWAHPRIALRVAQWCSPRFEVAVDTWLEEWLTRGKTPVSEVLTQYLTPAPRRWEPRYTREFYRQVYRLWDKAGDFPPDGCTQWGIWTSRIVDNLIYQRHFPQTVITTLRRQNPRMPSGGRRHKFMQRLTTDLGDPRLQAAVYSTTQIMRPSPDRWYFLDVLDVIHPLHQTLLPFRETVTGALRSRRPELPEVRRG